ncbi:Hsp20 family protein [Rhodospirillaceae bacterium SYSU D60014]|uniref:Hsp20 family protein n=1 Tax=Virgifigura deserti TaxID=2268457 RepID=UPI000E65FB2E
MRTFDFDFAPLYRSAIGFDRMMDLVQSTLQSEPSDNYPPYNIEKTGEDAYRITLAVAGFGLNELTLTQQQNTLLVGGQKASENGAEYLHQGIAARAFERRFSLADFVKVTGAQLENGLLSIDLVREVPEEMKPRRIAIGTGGTGGKPKAIEQKAA